MTTLLTLASRQIWQNVLVAAHLRPERVFLFHSPEKGESAEPAERLERFLVANTSAFGISSVERCEMAHDDFDAAKGALDGLRARAGLDSAKCALNFTGGNKLMATAAFEWARANGVQPFYLERGNKLIRFRFDGGVAHAEPATQLNPAIANPLDAVELLICQLGAGVVDSPGERLTLNDKGARIPTGQVQADLRREVRLDRGGFDFRKWLDIAASRTSPQREGDNLEYGVAAMLLALGVPCVHRSIELKPQPGSRLVEGELDLVFNWRGRLWVVDCKDKASGQQKLDNLKTAFLKEGVDLGKIGKHLDAIAMDLGEKDIKILREDLLQVSETGGLLGSAIAVRRSPLPPQAMDFAQSRRLEVILKDKLQQRLRNLLFPAAKASKSDVADLQRKFSRR